MSTAGADRSPEPTPDWEGASASLRWIIRPTGVTSTGTGVAVEGGRLNLCFNAVDRHVVAGRSDETALVADGPGGRPETWSWARLLEDVAALAGALRLLGAAPGSPVVVALPGGPDAVLALLACWRLGSVPHLLPADAGATDFAALLDDVAPSVLLTSAGTSWREALDLSDHPVASVVVRQPAQAQDAVELTEPRDLDWDLVARAGRNDPAPCERLAGSDPAYAVVVAGRAEPVSTAVAALTGAQQARARRLGPDRATAVGPQPAGVREVVRDVLAPMLAGAAVELGGTSSGDAVQPGR